MTVTIALDPTSEPSSHMRPPVPRPASLTGLTLGLLDISKPRGDVFLDRIERLFNERGIETRRYIKPAVSRKAPQEIFDAIVGECGVVLEALAD